MPQPAPTTPSASGPVLVTGAAGFVGSHLAERLLSLGRSVVGIDNFDPFYSTAIKEENVEHCRAAAQRAGRPQAWTFVRADITDASAMRSVFQNAKPSGVIHLAAKAGVRPSIADPAGYARINVLGTQIILDEAARAGCARVVAASSSSVYGNCPTAPFSEEMDVNEPISPYAATKRSCELIAHAHHHLTKQPVAMLRFFTVYGPRQRPDLAIQTFLNKCSKGEALCVFGDGTTSRDYTYIDDIVSGVLAAYDTIDRFGYRVWNLGNSAPVTLGDMVATIARIVGTQAKIERRPMQPGDVERTWADLTRSRAEIGYEPRTRFEEGVRRQWEWIKGK